MEEIVSLYGQEIINAFVLVIGLPIVGVSLLLAKRIASNVK